LAARGCHQVLRAERAPADLDGVAQLTRAQVAKALSLHRIAPERRSRITQ
jgi:predicted ATPase with chaperone activity